LTIPETPSYRCYVIQKLLPLIRRQSSRQPRGSLLDGAQLHRNVKPVEDVPRRLRECGFQALQTVLTVRNHGDIALALVSETFESKQPFCTHSFSRSARKREQDSSVGSDPAPACVADDRFETSRLTSTHLWDVSSINAEDKLPFQVSRQRQLALTAFLGINLFKEHALFFLFFQSLTNCQSAMSQGRVPSWHLPRQKIGQNFRRCSVRHKCAELSRKRHQFYSCTVRAEL